MRTGAEIVCYMSIYFSSSQIKLSALLTSTTLFVVSCGQQAFMPIYMIDKESWTAPQTPIASINCFCKETENFI